MTHLTFYLLNKVVVAVAVFIASVHLTVKDKQNGCLGVVEICMGEKLIHIRTLLAKSIAYHFKG